MKIRAPKYVLVDTPDKLHLTDSLKMPVSTLLLVFLSILIIIVCKSYEACGTAASHKMSVVFNRERLSRLSTPVMVQELYNHNSTIFKVFVIGDWIHVVKRKSLPNLEINTGKMRRLYWRFCCNIVVDDL